MRISYGVLAGVLLGALLLTGCGRRLEGVRELRADEVEQIEVYTGGVPADARRKTVTDPEEIERVLGTVLKIRIRREARDEELLAGALGLGFRIRDMRGEEYTLWWNDGQAYWEGKTYLAAGGPKDEADFWKKLTPEEESVSESELP